MYCGLRKNYAICPESSASLLIKGTIWLHGFRGRSVYTILVQKKFLTTVRSPSEKVNKIMMFTGFLILSDFFDSFDLQWKGPSSDELWVVRLEPRQCIAWVLDLSSSMSNQTRELIRSWWHTIHSLEEKTIKTMHSNHKRKAVVIDKSINAKKMSTVFGTL